MNPHVLVGTFRFICTSFFVYGQNLSFRSSNGAHNQISSSSETEIVASETMITGRGP